MKKFIKNTLSIFLALVFFCGLSTTFVVAKDSENTAASFISGENNIICIAHRGDWHNFPENSIEAVNAAKDSACVSVDLKVTSDSKIILFADDTLDRMCTDSYGKPVKGEVASLPFNQLRSYYLREENGSSAKAKTDFKIPEFCDVYNAVGSKTTLVLNVSVNDFDTVYKEIVRLKALKKVVFRINGSTEDILRKADSVGFEGIFTGNYQGNIIFAATSSVKKCFNHGINTVELGSANGHGVLYDNFLMKRFTPPCRAMVSMVNDRCGDRPDNETGWDDLISRGYSVIETDYPALLNDYIEKLNEAKKQLSSCIDLYSDTDLAPYSTKTEKEFTEALGNAENVLSSVSSASDYDNARFAVQKAHDSLTVGEKNPVTLSFKPTVGRVTAVVLCLAAFIASQVFLYKKRKKRID